VDYSISNVFFAGDYLIVGIHSDENIRKYSGEKYPIMKWSERVAALLSCKYVSEVILDAPYVLTAHLLDEFSISLVLAVDHELDFQKIQEVPSFPLSNKLNARIRALFLCFTIGNLFRWRNWIHM